MVESIDVNERLASGGRPASRCLFMAAGVLASSIAAAASADITGAIVFSYSVTAEDFGGGSVSVNVLDLYLSSDDAADVGLNVFNMIMPDAGQVNYFRSFTGTGWLPTNLGGPFDTAALRSADSFVTIGGFAAGGMAEQAPGAGAGTGLDPNFGGNNADYPGNLAGWYNSSPPSLNGQVGSVAQPGGSFGLGVLVGRFAFECGFSFDCVQLEATWNQGLGTAGGQAGFIVCGGGGGGGGQGCSPFDLDGNFTIDGGDLGIWLNAEVDTCGAFAGDFNGDGELSGADLGLLLNAWGTCDQPRHANSGVESFQTRLVLATGEVVNATVTRASMVETRLITTPAVSADLDHDGSVGASDLVIWRQAKARLDRQLGDLDRDGDITGSDLGILLSHWGVCP